MMATTSALGLFACGRKTDKAHVLDKSYAAGANFLHGVASGDPMTDRMVIWTRISPVINNPLDAGSVSINVDWQVARDAKFSSIVSSGVFQTNAERDFTVKVDVRGLEAGQYYYYRFSAGDDDVSPMGGFSTLPNTDIETARFAIVSCANFQAGYFNVYDHISRQDGFDAVIHLGDYFYEYGVEGWGGSFEDQSRLHKPAHEIVSLSDYRMRHAQYRTDTALQNMTARMPMICLWDDHESANDSYKDGAQNHQAETEGLWSERKAAALKAYYEWMPIRDPEAGTPLDALYKSYSYGDLLTLVSVETRLLARAKPIDIDAYTTNFNGQDDVDAFSRDVLNAAGRDMMGQTQIDFVVDALSESKRAGQPWRILANQVIMGRLQTPDLTPHVDEASVLALEADWPAVRDFVANSKYGLPVYPDSWDGYPWAREQFYERLDAAGVNDILVVTGDAHEFWVNDLTRETGQAMGLELGTTSVTSPTLNSYFGDATADYSLLMTQSNEDVRYYNALHNGYIDLRLTHKSSKATMIGLDTIVSRDYNMTDVASFTIKSSGKSLKAGSPKGLNLKQRALFSGLG